jgi:NTE family protein
VNFPHTGHAGSVLYYASLPELGADDRYQKIDANITRAFTYRSYTVVASGRFGSYISSTIPFYDEFTLGGFLKLSGYQHNQLRGQQVGLGRLIAYWRASQSLIGDFYLGVSFEAGNVWQKNKSAAFNDLLLAGSVFMGYDTALGLSIWASVLLKEEIRLSTSILEGCLLIQRRLIGDFVMSL